MGIGMAKENQTDEIMDLLAQRIAAKGIKNTNGKRKCKSYAWYADKDGESDVYETICKIEQQGINIKCLIEALLMNFAKKKGIIQ